MQQTSLSQIHKESGARMVEYAGFLMPLEYSGILKEHHAVRNAAGLFDVSHMGEFFVEGDKALDFLQITTTNDVSVLGDGQAQYSCLPNGRGGIVDDVILYRISSTKYMFVVNAANIAKDWNWLNGRGIKGAKLENASDRYSMIALQGPMSKQILQPLMAYNLSLLHDFNFVFTTVAGRENIMVSATGYTGAGGYEILCSHTDAPIIWKAICKEGHSSGLAPAGLAVRDLLRLEMGYCLYGNDIDDTTSAIEAGLGWIVKFVGGKNFIDRDILLKHKMDGTTRKLVGFEMIDKGIPRKDYLLFDTVGKPAGKVTSGSISPILQRGIGMGYLHPEHARTGNEILVGIRDKQLKARVTEMPFIKR